MLAEECGNCRFWMRRTDHTADAGGGFCRRYPPFFPCGLKVWLNGEQPEITLDGGFLNDAWPNTHQQSWCGEWNEKELP